MNDFDEEGNVIRGVYTNTCLKYDFGSDQWTYTGDDHHNTSHVNVGSICCFGSVSAIAGSAFIPVG